MTEVAYDIASGATFKFNTAMVGEQVRSSCALADDVDSSMNDTHACKHIAGIEWVWNSSANIRQPVILVRLGVVSVRSVLLRASMYRSRQVTN